MRRLFAFSILFTIFVAATFADLPFRNHRYDSFKVLPITSEDIVFIGNSITNMNEWWESFGSNHNVKNRGVSGAYTDEALANLEAIVAGKPKKIFLMIGTNDLGTQGKNTVDYVLSNTGLIVERIKKESPNTKIYIQSILPSTSGLRTLPLLKSTNEALKQLCNEEEITYIDLWDDLMGITTNTHSMDYLHLKASGYQIWCDKIAPHVLDQESARSSFPENTFNSQNSNGLGGAYGMRATVFSMLPVNDGDILVIGDEMIHGGEWHELLQSSKVKSRGTAWGYPGPDLGTTLKEIPLIFNKVSGSCNPSKVFLYAGVSDVNGNTAINTLKNNYNNIVKKIKELAPKTTIYLMSLQPTGTASLNTGRVVPFNNALKEIASSTDNVEYVDIYSDFVSANNIGKNEYFTGHYLYGKGYVKVAQKMAEAIDEEGITAITDEQADALIARFNSRTALGNAITKASLLPEGDGVGEYSTEALSALLEQIETAYTLLTKSDVSIEELAKAGEDITKIVNNTLQSINMPKTSDATTEHWYKLYTPLRDSRYLSSQGAGTQVVGAAYNNYAHSMWKFVKRNDGDLNIVNRNDNSYLSPTATYNSAISTSATEPKKGWTLSYSNTPGLFIISSGTVQLNQTQSHTGYKVYNWSTGESGTDRDDTGCQYKIELAGDPDIETIIEGQIKNTSDLKAGWYTIEVASASDAQMQEALKKGADHVLAADNEYEQNNTNFYSLKYAALDDDKPAKAFIYITPGNNGFNFKSIGGHKLNENVTSSRAALTSGLTAININDGIAIIGKWAAYFSGGPEQPYVGKMSNSSYQYKIYAVPSKELAGYDIYNVSITGAVNASKIGEDVRITCNNSANKGIDKVYNDGHFFFPKGTKISATDFSAPNNNGNSAKISISGNTINVEYGKAEYATTVEYSTKGNETWYYIVSDATNDYCTGKAIKTNGDGPLTYANIQLDPSMIWCFEKNSNGKVAIRNYAGKYMSKTQDKNHANAGMVDEPHFNYTITRWTGTSLTGNAFTIKSDASNQPIHAQQDNVVIVTWQASNNGASLWALRELTDEELNKEISISNLNVEHSAMGVGIGGTGHALLRIKAVVEGLSGNKTLDAIKGSVNSNDVKSVSIYSVNDMYEYYDGKPGNELLGKATPDNNGNFTINFDTPASIKSSSSAYYWLVADIKEDAKEGNTIDAEITSYIMDDTEKSIKNGNPQHVATIFLTASTVEYLNTNGSRYYRIPAITTAKNGWLVAVTDKRFGSNGDLPNNIDVVARVSKDNGITWSEPVTIAGTAELGGNYGHGDPAIVTDMVTGDIFVLVCSKEGFFYGTPQSPQLIKVIASRDNGETWEAPVDITNQLYASGCADPTRKTWHALFPSSGSFTQTKDGTLMCVAPVRYTSNTTHSTFGAHIISSSDHGKTWTLSNKAALLDADESKIVELDNGNLLVSSRHAGNRYYAVSSNGGESWSPRRTWSQLTEPGCNGDLIRLTSSSISDKSRLLHSIPNAGSRQNVTVFLSTDEGGSWPVKKSICPKGSAYSSLTVLPDGTIGCYYEEDGLEGGYQMRYVRFSLDWLTNGEDSIDADDIETGIDCITDIKTEADNTIYDLHGRRIENPSKGIYIINGRKVFIK